MLQHRETARRWGVLLLALVTLTFSACGDATESNNGDANNGTADQSVEIEGTWVTNYGSAIQIDDQTWGGEVLVSFDNEQNYAITQGQNPESGATEYSKQVWTEPTDGTWWYCTVDFGLESIDAAENTEETADDADPAEGGCGDFPWTKMSTPIELIGRYTTQFDSTEVISATTWDFGVETSITTWDNDENWAVLQNPEDADSGPNTFSKVVWTEPDAEGVFYYCTVDFGLETQEAAENTAETADDANPEEGGCGDFAWTKMTPEGS
ncbi:MAG: hypothetical protein ACQEVA_16510 [Myxococcota bacterium]